MLDEDNLDVLNKIIDDYMRALEKIWKKKVEIFNLYKYLKL